MYRHGAQLPLYTTERITLSEHLSDVLRCTRSKERGMGNQWCYDANASYAIVHHAAQGSDVFQCIVGKSLWATNIVFNLAKSEHACRRYLWSGIRQSFVCWINGDANGRRRRITERGQSKSCRPRRRRRYVSVDFSK